MDTNVKNANYGRVMAVIEKLLKDGTGNQPCCSCQSCINDIAAIALNFLPPHYYVEENTNLDLGSPWVMVETAVIEAMEHVRQAPHHVRNKNPPKS